MSTVVRHVHIVGPGRMGLALGSALLHADAVARLTVCGRRPEPPTHPLFTQGLARYVFGLESPDGETGAVFLAVPDAVVPEMAHALAGQGPAPEGCVAFHLSGALPSEVLAPLHARGYAVGSFHPLQAVANPVTGARRLPGSYVAVTGEPQAVSTARRLAAALGSRVITIPESKRPLYHAAAVMVSNYLPALLDLAARLLERCGVTGEDALDALLPLTRGTLSNIEELGLGHAVTGPVARGDVETVALHLRAMDPEERALYVALSAPLVDLVGDRLDRGVREALRDLLQKNS